MSKGLFILGFGGHARSVGDIALSSGFDDLIFIDDQAKAGEEFAGFPAVAVLPSNASGAGWFMFPGSGDNARRRAQCGSALVPLAMLVAPTASVGRQCEIGQGSLVAHQAHIGPLTKVGRGVIINSGAVVDHECVIGDFSHISVNATVAGRCRIGTQVLVGAGATVIDRLSICDNVIIGAGATVVRDIEVPGVYTGTPARRAHG
ncbi:MULTISPECIES: NeuD/PglB/VioB family sugar acetyltransferase [unclassified Mesorhizobium]|uniref:NeuD/PglB/VioB family sugar acetyltransferase n=1 Tax=unclassified Mesorhizobium TaxID=325217 RepID=UPI00112DCD55|nr:MULTISPECIES: NeuD/PglB/VioB family sugar acetyltransferase [unclassified Mesorhizobium]TPJ45333.1 acetyltransferase [Mesorhizobium sp. B2-6-6]MBZ9982788.1 NeuD/PglB/VioB family sugar acetyltransferase [Mesorhizobium sp. BR-1-1-8]MCA0002004.1 NeuD/PglB/VioB family sugar acetyltransferase [Mesorhizobium sp. B264B2A]MCA0006704.1 NeuD/PglB/VioB family sugar acetyltransferase [Mesorhizobium sp. B264B1B]MCA0017663.1 NeuD/PglB/VioB family sugar acetyltransferase [Mesorhizobium sp. B264B1A]